ncbi:flavoprotein [Streptomyces hydrogenans]|uniref:flavoprotein n=1 Tax=Streptomyces hydrogenans TaxID=1873719 RepID=UPI00363919DE
MSRDGSDQERPGINLLVGVCGAANAVNVVPYLLALRELPAARVYVVATAAAVRLVPAETLGLYSDAVFSDASEAHHFEPGHVGLATWADHVVVLPATAHMLGRAAHGLGGGLLDGVVLAHEKPVTFFPSMNVAMWRKPAVQRNVARLLADGHAVVDPLMSRGFEVATKEFGDHPSLYPPSRTVTIMRHLLWGADFEEAGEGG